MVCKVHSKEPVNENEFEKFQLKARTIVTEMSKKRTTFYIDLSIKNGMIQTTDVRNNTVNINFMPDKQYNFLINNKGENNESQK